MPFDRIFLDELSARNDIVDIVSQYVQLKKSGANYFGLCPFHNEKTGSFSVSPDKQIFHCFGCGAGGGVITFVMKAEGPSAAPPVTATGCMRCARTLRGFITKRCGSRKTAPRSSISSDAACRAAP